MAKNIVLCSDGTGNAGGKGRGTNVWRVFLAVDRLGHLRADARGRVQREQLAFYDDGVGTSTARSVALIGKAFGVGLSRNMRQLYTTLVRCYEPGDDIYLFGFSRGAYTIRSLAGMIDDIGILPRTDGDLAPAVARAYRAYRHQLGDSPERFHAEREARHRAPTHRPRIRFLGVWDTVSAVGVPFTGFKKWVVYPIAGVVRQQHRHDLNSSLVHVRHALAIDECRMSFELEMFNERRTESLRQRAAEDARHRGEPVPKCLESVEQVWFAGVHSNVGGGMPKKGLERVALHWMMCEAADHGLRFDPETMRQAAQGANVHSKLYDSRAGLAMYYRFRARDLENLCALGGTDPKIHGTAMDRVRRSTDGYAPINLPARYRIIDPVSRRASRLEGEDSSAGDSDEVHTFDQLVELQNAMAGAIEENIARARRINRLRELLYYPFLILSALIALTLLGQQAMRETRLLRGELQASGVVAAARGLVERAEALSASLDPVLGWTRPAYVWIAKLGQLVLPDFVAGPLSGLPELSSLATVVLAFAWLMLLARQGLIRRAHALGVERWSVITGAPPPATAPKAEPAPVQAR